MTTRGFGEAEATELAGWICDVIDSKGAAEVIERVKGHVLDLCKRFPVYGE